jgi:hypothetical protein
MAIEFLVRIDGKDSIFTLDDIGTLTKEGVYIGRGNRESTLEFFKSINGEILMEETR